MDGGHEETMKAEIGTFLALLGVSAKKKDLCRGTQLHADLVKNGLPKASSVIADALVMMYTKCGELTRSQELIYGLYIDSIFPWTALISGYVQQRQAQTALACYEMFQYKGISPDAVMFACILKACGSIGALEKGERIHDELAKEGLLGNDIVLGTVLVDMYAKCGVLVKARQILDDLHIRDVISWSALIAGYTHQGQGQHALDCFEQMQREGISPNVVTLTCILRVCSTMGDIDRGVQIHNAIIRQGWLGKDLVLGNALVELYAELGDLVKAHVVLWELPVWNVVSWSALITGYVKQGQGVEALRCFKHMQHEGLSPDAMTFTSVLKACGLIRAIDQGERLHDEIARQGLLKGNLVLTTALVDMYVRCVALNKAQEVLEELHVRDVFAWNVLIAGYAQEGLGQDALECLQQMQHEGLSPDAVTFTWALKSCSSIGAVEKGREMHDEIARQGLLDDSMALGSALIDMYVKCNELRTAESVLDELPIGDSVSWSALIVGHALEGNGQEAFKCFKRMQGKGIVPDSVTFSCVLNACCHRGLMDEGEAFFSEMVTNFGVKPNVEHYVSMVTLLGQAGRLDKAVTLIQNMPSFNYPVPSFNYPVVCSTLLGACCKWGEVEIGKWAFEFAVQLDRYDAAPYVYMASLYADLGMQEEAYVVEALRVQDKVWKNQRCNNGLNKKLYPQHMGIM